MPYPKITGLFLCLIVLSWQLSAEVGVDKKNVKLLPSASEGEQANQGIANSDIEGIIALSEHELEKLIGPIALYPDDLLAIVLPASTYPIDIVLASRFLDEYDVDNAIEPSDTWDESVVALLNYPEVLRMMDEEIDWTARLGYAVINQQADLIAAIETFRDLAYAAGNLETDEYQSVENNDGIIEITPVNEKVIYVPYYEPEQVIIYQTEPVYAYYPVPRPVYYYPYPVCYSFSNNRFWGVTTAFTIGWPNRYLHVHHRSYRGHPYYGHAYYGHYYRRPSISVYNTWYVQNHYHGSHHRHRDGDQWRSRNRHNRSPYHTSRVRNEIYSQNNSLSGHSENRGRDRHNSGQDQLSIPNEPGRTRIPSDTPRTTVNGLVNQPRVDSHTRNPITTTDRLADDGRSPIRGRDRLNTRRGLGSTPNEPDRSQNSFNTARATVDGAVNQPRVNGYNRNPIAATDLLTDPARARQSQSRRRTASADHAAIQFRQRSTNRVSSSERVQVSRVAQAGGHRQRRDATRPTNPSSYRSTTTAQTTRVQPHRTTQPGTSRSSSPDRSIHQTRSQQTSTRSVTEPSASVRRHSSRATQRQTTRPTVPQRQPSNPGANEPRTQQQRAIRPSTSTATARPSSGRDDQHSTAAGHSKPKRGRSRASNVR